jgi:ArsR family transcriptional regulator
MKTKSVNLMFQAFGHPTRLRILHLLRDQEMCVGDLVAVLRVPQPTASRHLRHLRAAGLVRCRRSGRWCFYSLRKATTTFHGRLLECVESCLEDVPGIQADARRALRIRRTGGCCADEGPKNR